MTRSRWRLPRPTVADRGLVAMVAALCTVLVLGAAAATAWLRVTADEMAAEVVGSAPWPARQLQVSYTEVTDSAVPPGAAAEVYDALADPLRAVLVPPRHAAVLGDGIPQALPRRDLGGPAYLSVVGLPDVTDQVEIVEGSFPRSGSASERLPRRVAAAYEGPRRSPVVEVALERSAAEALNLRVGTYLEINPFRYSGAPPEEPAVLRISGTYEATVPRPAPIDDVENVRRPAVSTLPEMTTVRAAAITADEETLLAAGFRGEPDVRWTFDPRGTPGADQLEQVAAEARRLAVQPWPPVLDGANTAATTGIGELSSSFLEERRASDTLALLALAALASAGLAVLVVAASVLEARRREVTRVLRARGASTRRLLLARAGEALLLVAPGVIGAGAAARMSPARAADLLPALVVAGLCVALLSLVQVAPWQGLPERVRLAARDALQLTAVALAVGATVLLLQRERVEATDPLLLALPGLLGVAGAVLVVRGVQVLTSLLRRLWSGATGIGSVVGTSQAGAAAARAVLPVAAVMLAGAAALVTVAVDDSLERAADRTSRQQVGADVAVRGAAFQADLLDRVRALPGVDEVAGVQATSRASLDTRVGPRRVTVVAVDRAAMDAVTGEEAAVDVPESPEGRLAALVSGDLDLPGEETTLDYAQSEVPVEVTGRVDALPGVQVEGPFVVVDVAAFRGAVDRLLPSYDILLLSGTPELGRVRDVVREISPMATVRTREATAAAVLAEEVVARTLHVARAVAVAGVLLAGFAALLAAGLGGPARQRTRRLLRDLGADVRQARWSTALELVPVTAVAGVASLGCGRLLVAVVGRGVDLPSLTGVPQAGALAPAWESWAGAALLVVALTGVVVVASARDGRRSRRPERTTPRVTTRRGREQR